MVIIFLIIGCLALFAAAMFIKNSLTRLLAILASVVVVVGSTALMVLNYHSHFGMEKVTTASTRVVAPVSAKLPIALYQPLGSAGEEEILMYKTSPTGKVQHTTADENVRARLKFATVSEPQMTTRKTVWRFKNDHYRLLFRWSGMDNTLIKEQVTLTYPRDYVKVTPQQMKHLKSAMAAAATPAAQAAQKQAVKAAIQAKLAQQPQATPQQKQAIAQQVQRQAAAQLLRKALNQH